MERLVCRWAIKVAAGWVGDVLGAGDMARWAADLEQANATARSAGIAALRPSDRWQDVAKAERGAA